MSQWTSKLSASEVLKLKGRKLDSYMDWLMTQPDEPSGPGLELDDGIIDPAPMHVDHTVPAAKARSIGEQQEDLFRLASSMQIDTDPRATRARMRSRRSHMIRKLKNRFNPYQRFTVAEAADRCNMGEGEMQAYLNFESAIPGTLIEAVVGEPGLYHIVSPWL